MTKLTKFVGTVFFGGYAIMGTLYYVHAIIDYLSKGWWF